MIRTGRGCTEANGIGKPITQRMKRTMDTNIGGCTVSSSKKTGLFPVNLNGKQKLSTLTAWNISHEILFVCLQSRFGSWSLYHTQVESFNTYYKCLFYYGQYFNHVVCDLVAVLVISHGKKVVESGFWKKLSLLRKHFCISFMSVALCVHYHKHSLVL